MPRERLSAGRSLDICGAENIKQLVSGRGGEGYDFVITTISHPRCCLDPVELVRKARELNDGCGDMLSKSIIDQLLPPLTVADISLTTYDWSRLIVVKPSPWIDPDSSDPCLRQISEQALQEELAYYSYLGVPAVYVRLQRRENPNLARIFSEHVVENGTYAVWVEIPAKIPTPVEAQNGHAVHDGGDVPPRTKQANPGAVSTATQTDAHASAGENPNNEQDDSEYEALVKQYDNSETEGPPRSNELNDAWHWFYEFRRACDSHRRVFAVLELKDELPFSEVELARWKGEPVAALKFDTRVFLSNRSGFPVLSKMHQALAKTFFAMNVQGLVEGPTLHVRRPRKQRGDQPPEPVDPTCLYYAYLNNLFKEQLEPGQDEEWASGYEDVLQKPLQPLRDHLDSEIYETFEKDPVKYKSYGQAFEQAVRDKLPFLQRKAYGCQDLLFDPMHPLLETLAASTYACFERDVRKYHRYRSAVEAAVHNYIWRTDGALTGVLVVMVLGAGRGPLVQCSYEVLKRANLSFKLYAIEKNPCALVTLFNKRDELWNNEVEVIFTDMRDWEPEHKADIVVSELLGSFGCNELSPECLDGALRLMKPECISIPAQYRSYLAPVHSPKLFNEVRATAEKEYNKLTAYESPYVCRVFNQFEIADCQPVFKFEHPNWKETSNERYRVLDFVAREACEMMGLVGYFYAVLFGRTSISTVPKYETTGLCSWFPILFSLQSPIYVKKGERIQVRFWRRANKAQVWYEWQLAKPVVTPIMNIGGRSHAIRLH